MLCGSIQPSAGKCNMSANESSAEDEIEHDFTPREDRPGQLTQVTRAMVAIYKDQFGRGPTHARTHYAGPDMIVCALEDTLTPIERTLVAIGEHQRLRDIRALFQHTAE